MGNIYAKKGFCCTLSVQLIASKTDASAKRKQDALEREEGWGFLCWVGDAYAKDCAGLWVGTKDECLVKALTRKIYALLLGLY